MKPRQPLTWPPRVGQRICRDNGPDNLNNYTAEVRAVVDDDYAVIRRWRPRKGWHTYEILDRLDVEAGNRDEPRFFAGPLPRASMVRR